MNSCQQQAMEKLLQGRGCANKLKLIMDYSESHDSSMDTDYLAKSVLCCFSDALSILIDTNDHQDHHLFNHSSPHDSSPVLESRTKPLHKRERKTSMVESSDYHRHESSTPIYHDGYLWRKYGQKQIKETDHKRSYYKCAYTKDQNCEAKKQVQKIQHDPPLYSTTYFGQHTCQLNQAYVTFPIDTSDPEDDEGSHMIRFGQPNTSVSPFTSLKYQHQNQIQIKDQYMTPENVEELSPSQWMSSEVAHAVEAFEFNPSWISHDL